MIQESQPQKHLRLFPIGQDRILGAVQNEALDVRLQEINARDTVLDFTGAVEVLGKIATLGQFVVRRKVKGIFNRFTRNVQAQLRPKPTGGVDA